jgi:hypothetical protein
MTHAAILRLADGPDVPMLWRHDGSRRLSSTDIQVILSDAEELYSICEQWACKRLKTRIRRLRIGGGGRFMRAAHFQALSHMRNQAYKTLGFRPYRVAGLRNNSLGQDADAWTG